MLEDREKGKPGRVRYLSRVKKHRSLATQKIDHLHDVEDVLHNAN